MFSPLQILNSLKLPSLRPVFTKLTACVNSFAGRPVRPSIWNKISRNIKATTNTIGRLVKTIKTFDASACPDNCPHCGHAVDYLELLKTQAAAVSQSATTPNSSHASHASHSSNDNFNHDSLNHNSPRTNDDRDSPSPQPAQPGSSANPLEDYKPLRPFTLRNFLSPHSAFRIPRSAGSAFPVPRSNGSAFRTSPECRTIPLHKLEAYIHETLAIAESLALGTPISRLANPSPNDLATRLHQPMADQEIGVPRNDRAPSPASHTPVADSFIPFDPSCQSDSCSSPTAREGSLSTTDHPNPRPPNTS